MSSSSHWRNTFRPVKFFIFEWPVGVVLAPTLLHFSWITIGIDLMTIGIGIYMYRLELTTRPAFLAFRCMLAGDIRPPGPPSKVRWRVNYGHPRTAWQKLPPRSLPDSTDNKGA